MTNGQTANNEFVNCMSGGRSSSSSSVGTTAAAVGLVETVAAVGDRVFKPMVPTRHGGVKDYGGISSDKQQSRQQYDLIIDCAPRGRKRVLQHRHYNDDDGDDVDDAEEEEEEALVEASLSILQAIYSDLQQVCTYNLKSFSLK